MSDYHELLDVPVHKRPINWFQSVWISRQSVIRAYCSHVYTVRRSLEGHFLGQMEAANSFDKYNKAKGEHNSRISRSAINF